MLRSVMHTTLAGDVSDPDWKIKIEAMAGAGVQGFSTVLTVSRPFCIYPFKKEGAGWNLWAYEPRYWEHLGDVIQYCNKLGLYLQLDLFNEPSLRHGNRLCWGKYGEPRYVREKPTGEWEHIVNEYVAYCTDFLNMIDKAAVLYVLEGTGSKAFEAYAHGCARDEGLKDGVKIISNSVKSVKGVIYSPHVHSLSAVRNHAKRGAYLSDDGWYPNSPAEIGKAVAIAKKQGCAAYESLLGGCLSGEIPLDANGEPTGGSVPYDKRKRPTLTQLRRGIVNRMIRELVG